MRSGHARSNAAYYKHAVLLAITSLSHLYFGFAVLAETAMRGYGKVTDLCAIQSRQLLSPCSWLAPL